VARGDVVKGHDDFKTLCADVQWRFLSFSISEWALAWFVLFLLTGVMLLIRKKNA